jgi:hypothetical protein
MVALPRHNVQPGCNRNENWRYETAGQRRDDNRRDRGRREALGTNGGCVSGQSASQSTAPIRTRSPRQYQRTPVRVEQSVDEQAQARIRQYRMQELAGDILPDERGLNACMRCRVSVADHVELVFTDMGDGEGTAQYTHLQTCGSIWLCAPCAARKAEERRRIMQRMNGKFIEGKDGGSIWMTTYTVSHHDYDALDELLDHFLAARKKMREGRQGMALRRDFDVVGTISVLEVTWSEENGWHPHVHELVYCRTKGFDADGYEALARPAWKRAAAQEGLSMNMHGFEVRRTYGAVQDYVTKYGHQPASEKVWGTESEMVKGHLKQSRAGLTPFAMLNQIVAAQEAMREIRLGLATGEIVDRAEAQVQLRELNERALLLRDKFREYARAFKGRKQLNPSKGVQPLWKAAEAEIEQEEKEKEDQGGRYTLISFYDDQWNEVVRRRVRPEVQEEGRTGRPGWVLEYLAGAYGIEIFPEQYTCFEGWQVHTPEGSGEILSMCYIERVGRWWCSVALGERGAAGRRCYTCDFIEITLASPKREESA